MPKKKKSRLIEISDEAYNVIFEPMEEITEALAIELCNKGWLPEQIHDAQAAGLVYSRMRDTFMTHWSEL